MEQDPQAAMQILATKKQLFQQGRLQTAYGKAVENKPILDSLIKQTASQTGGQYVTGLKSPDTAVKKVITKREEDPERNYKLEDTNDLSRARLIYPDEKSMNQAVVTFKDNLPQGVTIAKEDDYFKKPEGGYRGRHIDIVMPNGQHSEVQFHTQNTYANSMVTHTEHASFGDEKPKAVVEKDKAIAEAIQQLPPDVAQIIGKQKAIENAPSFSQGQQQAMQMAQSMPNNQQAQQAMNVLNTTNNLRSQPAMGGGGQTINHQQYTSLSATPAGVGGGGKQTAKAISIVKQDPILNTKRDISIRDVYGNKKTIPQNEALTPHILSNNQVILKDGEEHRVTKSAYEQVMQNSIKAEKKEFAPELKQIDEINKKEEPIVNSAGTIFRTENNQTKFSQYTLPGGQNYREVLLKAPSDKVSITAPDGHVIDGIPKPYSTYLSPHWDESNVLAHLRMNDRTTPDGKKVLFLEELQSDWANDARKKGFATSDDVAMRRGELNAQMRNIGNQLRQDPNNTQLQGQFDAASFLLDELQEGSRSGVPNNPLLKDWRGLALKRALKEAVDGKYDYLSWTNGKQQADRYNLSKQVDSIKWHARNDGTGRTVQVFPKDGDHQIYFDVDKTGKIKTTYEDTPNDWKGRNVADVIGKGVGEKIIQGGKTGTLKGEGLNIGGEWAHNLYDREVPNKIEDLTKGKTEHINLMMTPQDATKSMPSDKRSQQAIKITPQVKAIVQGQGAATKQPSGILPSQYAPVNNAQNILQAQNQLRTEPATQPIGEGGGGNRFIHPMRGSVKHPQAMQPNPVALMNATNFLRGIGGMGGGGYNKKNNTRSYGSNPL